MRSDFVQDILAKLWAIYFKGDLKLSGFEK